MAENETESALSSSTTPEEVSSLNPNLEQQATTSRPTASKTIEEYVTGIHERDRVVLSQAITLLESTRPKHQEKARRVLDQVLSETGDSIRVAITGVPGVGKSTFIESLGPHLVEKDHRLAVLTVDPSSERSKGSILGDKTRMGGLASYDDVYIRPSPTAGTLGGVARKTRETILLCEAAGYDVVLVETVGVGQSEVTVRSMVDFFLLLALAGAGDELQGIKRGIVEMADAIAINKADGDNQSAAEDARSEYEKALHLLGEPDSGWQPPVVTCSGLTGEGVESVWEAVKEYHSQMQASGFFQRQRQRQARHWMYQTIEHRLREDFFSNEDVQEQQDTIEAAVLEGQLSSFAAAEKLLDAYHS